MASKKFHKSNCKSLLFMMWVVSNIAETYKPSEYFGYVSVMNLNKLQPDLWCSMLTAQNTMKVRILRKDFIHRHRSQIIFLHIPFQDIL